MHSRNTATSTLLLKISARLKSLASPDRAEQMKKVAPGAQKIFGIPMPVLNEMAKEYKEGGFELVEELWNAGSFEEKMIAAKLLRLIARKDPDRAILLVQYFSEGIDNWAVCDTIGMQSLKAVNKIKQPEIFDMAEKFAASKIMWQRRLSLVLLEDFCKQKEYHTFIKKMINRHRKDPEYYMKKAVVWLLKSVNKER